MKKKIIPFIIGALMLTGCDDLFSPATKTSKAWKTCTTMRNTHGEYCTMYTV